MIMGYNMATWDKIKKIVNEFFVGQYFGFFTVVFMAIDDCVFNNINFSNGFIFVNKIIV
jgi:hypothetical protein